MAFQLKPEPAVEALALSTIAVMFDAHKMMYDFGYRGSFSTTTHDDGGGQGGVVESGRFDMVMEGAVPIAAALGDVILYTTSPLAVVKCVSGEEFAATYQTV